MPDFFKKLKKKVDKKKMTGADKMGRKERSLRQMKFLPFQASTTSIFCRQKKEDSGGEKSFSRSCLTCWMVYKCVICILEEVKPKKQSSKKKRGERRTAPLSRKQRIRQHIREKMLQVKTAAIEVYVVSLLDFLSLFLYIYCI